MKRNLGESGDRGESDNEGEDEQVKRGKSEDKKDNIFDKFYLFDVIKSTLHELCDKKFDMCDVFWSFDRSIKSNFF